MQKVNTAYYELEGTHYEIGRQMAGLLGNKTLHAAPLEIFTEMLMKLLKEYKGCR